MTRRDAKQRINKLRKEINRYRTKYHVENVSMISDAALDSLKKELVDLEQQFSDLITPESPTQHVGGKPLALFVKVFHEIPMLSLNDAFTKDDLYAWEERLQRLAPHQSWTYVAEPKIDGLAIRLIYEHGVLRLGATRGNGHVGEDVTQNIKTIESIPLRLEQKHQRVPSRMEIRGEVYMDKKEFERINSERQKEGSLLYQNPRNTAAGSIRQLDAKIVASRRLAFFAYALPTDVGQKTHEEEHILLRAFGFCTNQNIRVCKNINDVMTYYAHIQHKRENMPYQIDGIVVTVNENRIFQKFGVIGKAPRGAIAMKFPAEQVTTIVDDIQIQVGRTGVLTPVAHLQPVSVAGTTVKRATLHNLDEITRLDVRIGDTVIVQKAGDIIPDIVRVLPNLRTGKERIFRMPSHCPVCGSPITRRDGEVAYYCTNSSCFGQQREGLYHFVSKQGLDIRGLGPKIIDLLVDMNIVRVPSDIFSLTVQDLEPLERFAEKSAHNIVENIQRSRTVPLYRFLYALGIRHVGEQTALSLANFFGSLSAFKNTSHEQLLHIADIGDVVAESIWKYLHHPKHQKEMKALNYWLHIQNPLRAQSQILEGKIFLFTGVLEHWTREEAKNRVRSLGGSIASGVTKKLDFLVVGKESGSKLAKARRLSVRVLSEKEFLEMVGEKV